MEAGSAAHHQPRAGLGGRWAGSRGSSQGQEPPSRVRTKRRGRAEGLLPSPSRALPKAACAKLMSVWLPHLPLGPETGSPDSLQA